MEGIAYIISTIVIMSYPQILDIFNFGDSEFDAKDYKIAQMGSVGPFVIGCIFTQHGLVPYFNTYIVPIMMKNKKSMTVSNSPITVTIITIFGRLIIVPIFLVIAMLTFGSDNTMITILCAIFLVVDPTLAIISLFLIRRYGDDGAYEKVNPPKAIENAVIAADEEEETKV